jgi:fatty acid desaturase
MAKASRYLSPENVKLVSERSDLKGAWQILHAWGTIFGAMGLFAIWPDTLTFILAVLLIGGRQLGLAVLMHDGSHGVLFKTRKYNDFFVQWFCAYPVFSEMWAYRKYHLKHHRFTQQDKDPDLALSAPFPVTKASFRRKMVRDLTGQTTFKQRRSQFRAGLGDPSLPLGEQLKNFWERFRGPLIMNFGLFALLALVGKWHYYFLFWVLPFMTWQQLILRVRNIAEHALVPDQDDIYLNARTTKANPFMRAFLAPYFVNYHVEHHMMIYVPCYNLPVAHELLRRQGWHDKMTIAQGYGEVIRLATSANEEKVQSDKETNQEHMAEMFVGINGPLNEAEDGDSGKAA